MSNLLSSYIFEPVARQARRFSSSSATKPVSTPVALQPSVVSHANHNGNDDIGGSSTATTASRGPDAETAPDSGPRLSPPPPPPPPLLPDDVPLQRLRLASEDDDDVVAEAASPASISLPCSVLVDPRVSSCELLPGSASAGRFAPMRVDAGSSFNAYNEAGIAEQAQISAHTTTSTSSTVSSAERLHSRSASADTRAATYTPPRFPDAVPAIGDSATATSVVTTSTSLSYPPPGTFLNVSMARTARTSSTRDGLRSQHGDMPSSSLPADDGMRLLRQKIHSIRELHAPQDEKARQMHDLMTEEWQAAQRAIRPLSPASHTSQEPVLLTSSPLSSAATPASTSSILSLPTAAVVDSANPFNIQSTDLHPTYRSHVDAEQGDDARDGSPSNSEPAEVVLGCKHYKRNVKIQCHDCRDWHSCRHCHDAATPSHHLNRRATENMLCMLCWTPQAAAQDCKECGQRGACYYCDICKLWDDDASKSIYHCPDCGICRRGEGLGKDFVHCKKCNVCISIAHYATHTCLENATDSNCPLCLDYMFTSPLEIVAMPCGHYLHHHCYTSLMLSSYQCPICKRSAVNMETQWRKLEEEIRHQPMPSEWGEVRSEVKCNDCAATSIAPFHWLGVKCGRCDGFNTVQTQLLAGEDVQRDLENFAEQRRERLVEEHGLSGEGALPRIVRGPVTVRPYFLDDEQMQQDGQRRRARSSEPAIRNSFALPDLPRLPEFGVAGRLPQLPEFSGRLPSLPNMPTMPGFALPFDMLGRVGRYFDDQIAEGVPRQFRERSGVRTSAVDEEEWRQAERWFLESSDDEDEDDDDEFEDESEDEAGEGDESGDEMDMDDDEGDEEGESDVQGRRRERLELDLFGHP